MQGTTYATGDTIGRQYRAPTGSKIVRVTFDYATNYDPALVHLALDRSGVPDAWANLAYGTSSGAADLRFGQAEAPEWIALGLYQTAYFENLYFQTGEWHGQICNLVLYYTTDHALTTTQRVDASTSRTRIDYSDGFGRVFATKLADESGQYTSTFQSYDANGRLLQQSVPTQRASGRVEEPDWPNLVRTSYTYDTLDRPRTVQAPASGTTTWYYSGWTSQVVDANGHCRSFSRDAAGRTVEVRLFDGTYEPADGSCGSSHLTRYTYDAANRLAQVLDAAGHLTRISYDGLGRKTHLSDPDVGEWSYGYDANGNLTTQIDARGQVALFGYYDALNRPTAKGRPSPVLVSAAEINGLRLQINQLRTAHGLGSYVWQHPPTNLSTANQVSAASFGELRTALVQIPAYSGLADFTAGPLAGGRAIRVADLADLRTWVSGSYQGPRSDVVTYSYDAGPNGKGRRSGLVDALGSTSYGYDARGRLTSETRLQGGQTYTLQYGYNAADERTTLTYPGATPETVTTTYNARGLPSRLTTTAPTGTYVSSVSFDALGRPLTTTYGSGAQSTFGFDGPTRRLRSFVAPGVARSYGYDAVGNVTCLDPAGVVPCNTGSAGVERFAFDAQDQVVGAWIGSTAIGSYGYDADRLGNLTSKSEAGSAATLDYGSGAPVHAPKTVTSGGVPVSYSYDRNGNLQSRGSQSLVYDWENRLVQVSQAGSTVSYGYDGDGRLARRVDVGGTVDYVGEVYEKSVSSGVETKRYYLGDRLVGTRVGGTGSYLFGDYLRSTVAASGGAWVEYAPFGLVRAGSGTLPTDRRFTGQRWEAGSGLYQMGGRWYDPAIGRFLQPDALVPNPGNPLDLNRYAYVQNNPLKYRDPSGHVLETAWDIVNVAWDLYEVSQDPSLLNVLALTADLAAVALPVLPGGVGLVVRAGKAGKVATEVASHADEAVGVAKAVDTGVAAYRSYRGGGIHPSSTGKAFSDWFKANILHNPRARGGSLPGSSRRFDIVDEAGTLVDDGTKQIYELKNYAEETILSQKFWTQAEDYVKLAEQHGYNLNYVFGQKLSDDIAKRLISKGILVWYIDDAGNMVRWLVP